MKRIFYANVNVLTRFHSWRDRGCRALPPSRQAGYVCQEVIFVVSNQEPEIRSAEEFQTLIRNYYETFSARLQKIAAFGHDIYAVSAPLVVEACLRVMSKPPRRGGRIRASGTVRSYRVLSCLELRHSC